MICYLFTTHLTKDGENDDLGSDQDCFYLVCSRTGQQAVKRINMGHKCRKFMPLFESLRGYLKFGGLVITRSEMSPQKPEECRPGGLLLLCIPPMTAVAEAAYTAV